MAGLLGHTNLWHCRQCRHGTSALTITGPAALAKWSKLGTTEFGYKDAIKTGGFSLWLVLCFLIKLLGSTPALAALETDMITVGAFEAKTHLSTLLERVSQGEEVVITRHGKPVARLVLAAIADRSRVDQTIAKLKGLRTGCTLGGLSWKELRDQGRR